eukprot:scaffold99065_cov126-Cyclotella_meneghiniana.AAC.1
MSFARASNQLGFAPVHITRVTTVPPSPYHRVAQISTCPRLNRRCISMVQSQDEEVESITENTLLDLSSITGAQDDLQSSVIEINSRPLDDEASDVLQPQINPIISPKKHQQSNKRRMQMFSCFLVAIDTLDDIPNELRHGIHIADT